MTASASAPEGSAAVKNLRVRFWGVQGSCPLFPEAHEVEEYKSLVAQDAIRRVIADLRDKLQTDPRSVERLLSRTLSNDALADYQRELGVADLPVYGGETTCVSIETSDDQVLVLDGGSGIRNAGKHLVRYWGERPRELYILATHEHLDHRMGLPFCQFCFVKPPLHITVYGTRQLLDALDQRYGLFSRLATAQMHFDDPVDYRNMSATFEGIELPDVEGRWGLSGPRPWRMHEAGKPIRIGSTTIEPFDVYHGMTRCVAYKIHHGSVTFVFATDHELRHGHNEHEERQKQSLAAEKRVIEYSRGADLAYFDGQYFLEEYYGRRGIGITTAVPRLDWGHGCIEDVVKRCRECGVKHALVGHHDPERSWQERLELDQWLIKHSTGNGCRIELAKSDMMIDL